MIDPRLAVFDPALMQGFSDCIAQRIGLHYPPERWQELWHSACGWADASGEADPAACMREWMAAPPSRAAVESLAAHLSVGETYFFREPLSFELLATAVLPPLIAARRASGRRLRLWSAGCASGEEAYSLAILLQRLIPDIADWDVRILGTDVNAALLGIAREAIYGEWSFRGSIDAPFDLHFERLDGDRVQVRPALRRIVDFEFLNLADDALPAASIDLVLCRHVLMYFEPAQARQLLDRLQRSLADDGWLVVGVVEGGHRPFPGFEPENIGGGAFFRKQFGAPLAVVEAADAAPVPVSLPEPPPLPAHAEQCRLEEILALCRSAIAADRCNAELHHLQGLVHEELGQLDEARQALRRALFLDPGCVVAHLALGRLCEMQGQGAPADRHVANALELLRRRASVSRPASDVEAAPLAAALLAKMQGPAE